MTTEATESAETTALPPEELRGLIDSYATRFPWYGALLEQHGVRRTGRLTDLPPMDQDVLGEHYYSADHDFPDAHAFLTSGTSGGTRKRILYGPRDDEDYVAQRRELFAGFLAGVPAGDVAVGDLGTGHAAASARRIFTELGLDARDIDFTAPLPEHLDKLAAWQPSVLFTMPMILDRIMAAEPEPGFRPSRVMVVGDVAPAAWRANVARYFGIGPEHVLDVFGSIEIGAIAFSCAATGLYHFHDHIVPEVVSPDTLLPGAPARAPGDGVLLLTSTTRQYFPALRYVTGDVISGLRTIVHDGRTVHAFDRIEGRITSDLKHGERLSGHDLTQVMARVFPGRPFEAADDGELRIRVAGDPVTADQVRALRAAVADVAPDVGTMIASGLVGEIEVEAVAPEDLRSGHGKRRFDLRGV